jgi:hypothetical protein
MRTSLYSRMSAFFICFVMCLNYFVCVSVVCAKSGLSQGVVTRCGRTLLINLEVWPQNVLSESTLVSVYLLLGVILILALHQIGLERATFHDMWVTRQHR